MENKRKRRFGDRREGRRLRKLDPYNAMTPFIMKEKSDASNYFSEQVEVTEVERFLRKKRVSGYPGMGMLHIIIATFIRTASQYPAINRFCSGQRIYSRENVDFLMTIKKQLRTDAGETTIKISFGRDETINDVYEKINAEINKVRNEGTSTNTDIIAAALMKLPRVILRFTVAFLELLDYFGLMPKFLIDASPFHGSVIITDMGSIGLPAIYHHLYNFGNLPIFIALGAKKKVNELNSSGEVVARKYIEFKLVVDERICDGFYFSQAFKVFKRLLKNPESLDKPPEVIINDIE
ncbi:MAG: 2-oxo acid dehydrogenase subunit E2 [Oscillospiraceae bacterium]|nr:2-oxo acid dehydrogenase subunit E2 [Oscillospiraceae bacterium]